MPELNHEKVMTMMQQSAVSIMDNFEEPVAIAFAVTWDPRLGETDLPFGTAVFRKGKENSVQVLTANIRQLSRLLAFMGGGAEGWGKRIHTLSSAQAKVVDKQQEIIDDLKQRLAKYEPQEEAPRSNDGGNDPKSPPGTGGGA
ncbi:MAG: hypothetical protein GTO63_02405 [Anaerolineae bacterium]|nr:hypothetical protein [Anaerolineae bacterium]NIN93912.1 hypothetical protein [Anaerolineae bacterium]NIQ76943.1 hypothetical protein [Anaerolineae bacterium]